MSDISAFLSHLVELRSRLIKIAIVLIVTFAVLAYWASDLYKWLAMPMLNNLPQGGKMIATDVTTPFFVPMKVALMAAFLVTLPHTLYQIWAFIAPGLYRHEKRLALPLIVSSTLLFILGMAFAYALVFPVIFHFMTAVAPAGVTIMTDINKYLDFVLIMFMAFGITFEVPVVVIVLVKLGIVDLATLKTIRSYIIVLAFVIAAIITPPDVLSQVMLAVPLCLLYELGIFIAGLTQPKTNPH